jgi:RHS repeat-associated protein
MVASSTSYDTVSLDGYESDEEKCQLYEPLAQPEPGPTSSSGTMYQGSKTVTMQHSGSSTTTPSDYSGTNTVGLLDFESYEAYGDVRDAPLGESGSGGYEDSLTLLSPDESVPASGTGLLSSQASWLTSPSAVTPIELSADAPAWAAYFAVPTAAELTVELAYGGSAPALSWSTSIHGQTPRAAAVPDRGAYDVQQEAAAQDPPASSGPGETFNSTGQITSVTDALLGVTKATYDDAQRLTSVTDPPTASHSGGNTTSWTYNNQNRVTSQTTALGTSSFAYASPSCGNLTQYTDADGRVTTYQYDCQNRVTQEAWYSSASALTANNPEEIISYTYNADGDITSESDFNCAQSVVVSADYYTYNDSDQLTAVVETIAGGPTVELVYTYSDSGECSGVTASIGGTVDSSGNYTGGTLDYQNTYGYDDNGDLIQIVQSSQTGGDAVATKEIDLTYNAAGQFQSIDRYLGQGQDKQLVAESGYTYNSAGQLTGLVYQQGTTPLANYGYTYGAGGGLSQVSSDETGTVPFGQPWSPSGATLPFHDPSQIDLGSLNQAPSPADLLATVTSADGTTSYSYDALGELTSASGAVNESYAWDANGNPESSGYTIGPENEILSDGTYTYTYNLDGDMLSRTQISSGSSSDFETDYTWDNRNRLIEVTNKDNTHTVTQTVTYVYDVENRWIGETVTTYSDGSPSSVHTTDFAYDGNQIVLQFDGTSSPGSPVSLTANNLSHRYVYGPAVDQVLADERVTLQNGTLATDEVLWPLADAQGTVRDVAKLTGTTAAVVDHVIYNSFGGVVSESDPSRGVLFKYTGCATDNNTDIEFHYQRPKIAGSVDWLKIDQSGFTSGTTNLSDYCANDPVNGTDPSGEAPPVIPGSGLVNGQPVQIVGAPPLPTTPGPAQSKSGIDEYLGAWARRMMRDNPPKDWMNQWNSFFSIIQSMVSSGKLSAQWLWEMLELRRYIQAEQNFRLDFEARLGLPTNSEPGKQDLRFLTSGEQKFLFVVMQAINTCGMTEDPHLDPMQIRLLLQRFTLLKYDPNHPIAANSSDGWILWFSSPKAITLGEQTYFYGFLPDEDDLGGDGLPLLSHEFLHAIDQLVSGDPRWWQVSYVLDYLGNRWEGESDQDAYKGIETELAAWSIESVVARLLEDDPGLFATISRMSWSEVEKGLPELEKQIWDAFVAEVQRRWYRFSPRSPVFEEPSFSSEPNGGP